jgi:hypothetical protein
LGNGLPGYFEVSCKHDLWGRNCCEAEIWL